MNMNTEDNQSWGLRVPILQGVLPVKATQIPAEVIAGLTLTALAIPEVIVPLITSTSPFGSVVLVGYHRPLFISGCRVQVSFNGLYV